MTQETNDVVGRMEAEFRAFFDELGHPLEDHDWGTEECPQVLVNAMFRLDDLLQRLASSQSARIAELERQIDRVVSGGLPEQLLADADELEGCGAGNEAKRMRELVGRLKEFRRASLTKDSTSAPE